MASIQYSGIVTSIRGSVHGTTFQGGLAAPIVRGKTRFKSNFIRTLLTSSNNTYSSNMQLVAQSWASIGTTARAAYASAAPSFPFFNKFGITYTPSAFQLYCWQNLNLLTCSLAMQSTPPSVVTFPSLAGASLVVSPTAQYEILGFAAFASDFQFQFFVSSGFSSGRAVAKKYLKLINVSAPVGATSVNVSSQYFVKLGNRKRLAHYFAGVKIVSTLYGSSSSLQLFSAICG